MFEIIDGFIVKHYVVIISGMLAGLSAIPGSLYIKYRNINRKENRGKYALVLGLSVLICMPIAKITLKPELDKYVGLPLYQRYIINEYKANKAYKAVEKVNPQKAEQLVLKLELETSNIKSINKLKNTNILRNIYYETGLLASELFINNMEYMDDKYLLMYVQEYLMLIKHFIKTNPMTGIKWMFADVFNYKPTEYEGKVFIPMGNIAFEALININKKTKRIDNKICANTLRKEMGPIFKTIEIKNGPDTIKYINIIVSPKKESLLKIDQIKLMQIMIDLYSEILKCDYNKRIKLLRCMFQT